jgi:hypothetical protein
MLAVAVHGDCPWETLLTGGGPPVKEGGAFALRLIVPEDLGAGASGEGGGIVRGTVIDHQDVGQEGLDA